MHYLSDSHLEINLKQIASAVNRMLDSLPKHRIDFGERKDIEFAFWWLLTAALALDHFARVFPEIPAIENDELLALIEPAGHA